MESGADFWVRAVVFVCCADKLPPSLLSVPLLQQTKRRDVICQLRGATVQQSKVSALIWN